MKQRFLILVATLVAVAVVVPAALAGGPSDTQYPTGSVLVATAKKPHQAKPTTKPLPTKSTGTLPFTGANLAAVGAIGVLLAAGGITLTMVSRRRNTGE
jgi:hypothetical protein